MTVAYWIIAGLLAFAFLAAGAMKATKTKEALASSGMAWVEGFSAGQVKLIGIAEVVGAIALVLALLLNIAPVLSPVAAVALALLMAGAVVVHIRRKEAFLPALVLGVLSVIAAVLGFMIVL